MWSAGPVDYQPRAPIVIDPGIERRYMGGRVVLTACCGGQERGLIQARRGGSEPVGSDGVEGPGLRVTGLECESWCDREGSYSAGRSR